jgi:hypothetical protein
LHGICCTALSFLVWSLRFLECVSLQSHDYDLSRYGH